MGVPQKLGRYSVFGELASGGMATVYLGRLHGEAGFGRTVAIKRLHPHLSHEPEFVLMFRDEARMAARIAHPNVVPTLDVVTTRDELFLVMEYVQGESLAVLLRAAKDQDIVMPVPIATSIALGLLAGLHAAHEAKDERGAPLGVVHRDVSPQNVIVGADGVTRLLDFGVARATTRLVSTQKGQLKGKLRYMAPEQLRGVTSPQTDVYAAGLVLWEALTRERLVRGDSEGEVMTQVAEAVAPPPSRVNAEVSAELDRVVAKALAKHPEDRWQSAADLATALDATLRPASAMTVSAWLKGVVGPMLDRKAPMVAAAESGRASQLDPATRAVDLEAPTTTGSRRRDVAPNSTRIAPGLGSPGNGNLAMLAGVAAYLARLPEGIHSYPACQIKGAIVSAALGTSGLRATLEPGEVPECVAKLTSDILSVGAWVPEVHYGALVAALYDVRFRQHGGLEAFDRWVYDGNAALFRSALYRVLFAVVSPERVFIGTAQRWTAFHRGSELQLVKREGLTATLRLRYPSNLFADRMIRAFGIGLRAAGDAAGAKRMTCEHHVESDTAARFELAWE